MKKVLTKKLCRCVSSTIDFEEQLAEDKIEFIFYFFNKVLTEYRSDRFYSIEEFKKESKTNLSKKAISILLKRFKDDGVIDYKKGYYFDNENPVCDGTYYTIHEYWKDTNEFVYLKDEVIDDTVETTNLNLNLNLINNVINNSLRVDYDLAIQDFEINQDEELMTQLKRLKFITESKTSNCKHGEKVNRVYSILTETSSKLHKYLRLDNQSIIEIDGKASQARLISLLCSDVQSEFHKVVEDNIIYDVVARMLFDFYFKDEDVNKTFQTYYTTDNKKKSTKYKNYLITNNTKESKMQFLYRDELVKYVMNAKEDEVANKLFKKQLKKFVYSMFFSGFNSKSLLTKAFEKTYPEIVKKVKEITILNNNSKTVYLKDDFATILQNIEADIYVKTCIKLINQGINCLTKHDAIIISNKLTDEQIKYVKDTLFQAYKDALKLFSINMSKHITIDSLVNTKPEQQLKLDYIDKSLENNYDEILGNTFYRIKKGNRTSTLKRSELIKKYKLSVSNFRDLKNHGTTKAIKLISIFTCDTLVDDVK